MGEGDGHEDTPRQAKQILMWGPSVGVIFVAVFILKIKMFGNGKKKHGTAISNKH